MSLKALFCTYLLWLLIPISVKGQCLSKLTAQPTYSTDSPINVNPLRSILANYTSPITIYNGLFNFLTVANNGTRFEAYVNEKTDSSSVTGGVLCNKSYKLHKIFFLINQNNIYGRSGNTVLGRKAPIEVIAAYYDEKYGSFDNAEGKPSGIVQISNPVLVGLRRNPLFTRFGNLLNSGALRRPGSSVQFPSQLVYRWFDALSFNPVYYAYIGSYYLGAQVDRPSSGAINIVPARRLAFISYKQFQAFKNVLGTDDQPIELVPPISPQGDRPVYKGFGFVQKNIPL